MTEHEFTIGHLFAGIGGGALGTAAAIARFGPHAARFRTLGGVDVDPLACADFSYLTGAPATVADLHEMTPAELRAAWGDRAPDAVLLSPPCKGFSALLSARRAAEEKYQRLNRLVLDGLFLLCSTWAEPPALIFLENVPRIMSRGGELLGKARQILGAHGYAVTPDDQHNCGELGGLAQNRMRFFLVARCRRRVPQFVYKPPKRRVRACGEVLGPLPIPGDVVAGGPLHAIPRISWRNWVRLALIPAGGDWRDLPGVVPLGKARREQFRRHAVSDWQEPIAAVVGPGGGGVENVADPRFANIMQVAKWDEPARTVIGASRVGSGALSVADPRLAAALGLGRTADGADTFKGRPGLLGVSDWDEPAPTVTATAKVSGSNAPAAVADPRVRDWNPNVLGVQSWDTPAGTVTGHGHVTGGRFAVADPRAIPGITPEQSWHREALGVIGWEEPTGTVTGQGRPACGRFSVADPRLGCEPRRGTYRVLGWEDAAATITGSLQIDNGAAAVADPRIPLAARVTADELAALDPDKPPPFTPIIIAADGTWHRPLTTLELAALQGLPVVHAGAPLRLAGTGHTRWREAIGNAIPPPAAQAIAEQLLLALLVSKLGAFTLSAQDIWVAPRADVDVGWGKEPLDAPKVHV